MNKKKNIVVALISILLLGSCTKDFKELNTDPNSSEKALPDYLMARALRETVSNNMSRTRTLTNELMQVTVNTLVETNRIFRYDIANSVSESPWNNWYLQLTNFKDMYSSAEEGYIGNEKMINSFKGISLICQSWVHSMITDTYGDVPYFDANKGGTSGIFTPKFDAQKEIYLDIFEKLEEANELLSKASNIAPTSDPIYKGNIANWRKFGNSLYLRLLLRTSNKEEVSALVLDKIREIVEVNKENYPMIASNEESAILRWTGAAPYASPFVSLTDAQWKQPKAASFFVDGLLYYNDPCIDAYLMKSSGEYEGIPSGYMPGETPDGRSTLATTLKSSPLTGNILNYGEVQFMMAELAARELISTSVGTAQSFFNAGVTARITLWGKTATAVSTYLANPNVAWDNALDINEKMEKIHYQKYLSLLYTDVQSWAEYRRTGHPILPKGPGLFNDKIMPTRLYYPSSVQAANPNNYREAVARQGGDDLKTLTWWQSRNH